MTDSEVVEKFVSEILISMGWRENKETAQWFRTFYQPSAFWPKNEIWFTYIEHQPARLIIWGRTAFDKTLPRQSLDVSDPDIKKRIIEYAENVR